MAKVTGTNNADKITVEASKVIVVTGKNKTTRAISNRVKNRIYGNARNDIITVRSGSENHIYGDDAANRYAGKDRITVTGGSKNKIYGGKGDDTITVNGGNGNYIYGDDAKSTLTGNDTFNVKAGSRNRFYGGKGTDTFNIYAGTTNYLFGGAGNDTFNINGGTTSYLYGGAGSDTFVIGKNSTGTAIVRGFTAADKVKVRGSASNIYVSKNNIIIKRGRSASLTLENAKTIEKSFTVTDSNSSNYSYTVKKGVVGVILAKDFTGTFTAPSFATTIDARRNTNGVTIEGNKTNKTKTVYIGEGICSEYEGGAGSDRVNIYGGSRHQIHGGAGSDVIRVFGGTDHYIYGGAGSDNIRIYGGSAYDIYGDAGNDIITVDKNASVLEINGGPGDDTITINGDCGTVYGDEYKGTANANDDNDTIIINAGTPDIYAGKGSDKIYINKGAGDCIGRDNSFNTGEGNDYVEINAGSRHIINNDKGDDKIIIGKTAGDEIEISGSFYDEGKDKVYIKGGNKHDVNLSYGDDYIEATAGDGHTLRGGDGNDTIIVTGGNEHEIFGDDASLYDENEQGNDIIKVTGGSGHRIVGGAGDDQITVSDVDFSLNMGGGIIWGGSGNDTIIVSDCKKAHIEDHSGYNKITVSGGSNHVLDLGGENYINIAAKNVIILGDGDATISVNWAADIGKLDLMGSSENDKLIINNASLADFTFEGVGNGGLNIVGDNGKYIALNIGDNNFGDYITIGGQQVTREYISNHLSSGWL